MRVLILGFCAFCLCGCGSKVSDSQMELDKSKAVFNWKMVTTWPKNFPGLGTAPEVFAEMVGQMSGGRLSIKVFGAGQLIPAFEVFDAVSQGTAEMGHGAAYYWAGKARGAEFFATVPFGLNAQEMNSWIHHGGGLELWREMYEPFGLIPFAAGNTGVQMAGWYNREIKSMSDIVGLKIRIPGLGGDVLSRAGALVEKMAGGDIYTAMQTGVIDATEWVGPYNDLALGLHQVAEYYYYPGWHEPGVSAELIVNAEAFGRIPQDLQTIVEVAARAVNQNMLDEYTAKNNHALEELVKIHGVKVRRLPEQVLSELKNIANEVITEQSEQTDLTRRVAASLEKFKSEVMEYHYLSEEAFYEARRSE